MRRNECFETFFVCECELKCLCGLTRLKCSFGLIAKILKEREEGQAIRFLKGLNNKFSSKKI